MGWIVVELQIFIFLSFSSVFPSYFESKAHTFVVKRCRRRNNINVRCIMSSKQDLLNMKRSQLLCWNGFNRRKPPILLKAVSLGIVRPPYSFQYAWLLGVCEGSVLVLMSESLFSIKKKKKRNNNKWVCMWVLHAIVLICTGVPKTYVARSPIVKKTSSPAALTRYHQPHPKRLYNFTSSPRPGSRSLTCGGGWRGGTRLPPCPLTVAVITSVVKNPVCKLLVNPADKESEQAGGRRMNDDKCKHSSFM